MDLKYKELVPVIIQRLKAAHDPKRAKIRALFFKTEHKFFERHIRNKKVLIAGSGLGDDSFELARYNKRVVGVELLKDLIVLSRKRLKKRPGLKNLSFVNDDFMNLEFSKHTFDVVVLNMGTIGDFKNKKKILKELLRVGKIVYFDFYPPTLAGLKKRKEMHKEELWQGVRIKNNAVISGDGLYSVSISKEEITKMVKSIGAKIRYYKLCDFAVMAEVAK